MPYSIRKVRGKPCYKLMNKNTKKTFSKCTTKTNARSQLRLLNAIKYNKSFKLRNKTLSNKNKSRKGNKK